MTVQQATALWGDKARFIHGPRQNGKTTQAIKDANLLGGGAVLFTPTVSMAWNMRYVALRAIGHSNPFPIVSIGASLDRLHGRHDEEWLFDEYSHMKPELLAKALDLAAIVGVERLVFIGEG